MTDISKAYEGGYYMMREPIIRGGLHKHTAELSDPISDATLTALNAVQATPWRINTWLLGHVEDSIRDGDRFPGLPEPEVIFPDRVDEKTWASLSDEDRMDHKRRLSELWTTAARAVGINEAFLTKVRMAQELRDEPEIFFPHFFDFRLRMYPMSSGLSPQSDDLGKALLMFAEGKRVGAAGLAWLASRLGATFGNDIDKLSHRERIHWTLENEELIFDSARDPKDGHRFWLEAEEPWSFLATCHEWTLAHELPNPEDFVSHLPVQVDGSVNGCQHLSMLGRDPVGAVATNLTDCGVRYDLYTQVAEEVKRLVTEDAVRGVDVAHLWVGRITRKTVKRAVMTTPYGVTDRGIRDQLVSDGHTADIDRTQRGAAADYLRDKIVEAMANTISAAKDIMAYIQAVARVMADANVPMRWTTPAGSQVQQSYYSLARQEVKTLQGSLILWAEDPLLGLNARKNALAAAPNYIHSMDAAHLQLTVNAAAKEGITSFSMIHDSFGCHAADMGKLSAILREQMVSIYEDDWLLRFHQEQRERMGDNADRLPEPPARGSFDVRQVRSAEFAFA